MHSHLFICLSVYLFICLSVYLFICLSVYLFICLSVYLFICLFVYLFICLFVYLFICLFVYLFIYSGDTAWRIGPAIKHSPMPMRTVTARAPLGGQAPRHRQYRLRWLAQCRGPNRMSGHVFSAGVTAVQCAQARLPPLTCGYHSADGSRAGDLLATTGAWQWVATGYRNRRRLQTVT
ncbi:MAG: hypothetical protein ACRCXB_19710 [Aeromonadaceae bacterium]